MTDDRKHDGRDDLVVWQVELDGRVLVRASLAAPPGCQAGALRIDAVVVEGPDGPRLILVAAGG